MVYFNISQIKNGKNYIKNIKSTKKVVLPQSYIKALPSTQGIQ